MTDQRKVDIAQTGGHTRVFINYRRGDTKHAAGRMHDAIVARFGRGSVFVDVESIEPGLNYVRAIDVAVSSCDVMLVLIGETWLQALDDQGRRRLDDPADRLRLEVEAGLRHNTRVIPVLVDSATMPKSRDLPPSLVELSQHHATRLRHDTFQSDAQHLLGVIERAAGTSAQPPDPRVTGPTPLATSQRFGTAAKWLALGAMAAAVLAQLAFHSSASHSLLLARPQLPHSGPWVTLVWLLPTPLVIAAAWLVAKEKLPGIALGCIASAALWVIISLVFIESRHVEGEVSSYFLTLTLLLLAAASLIAAAPDTREGLHANRWDRTLRASTLLAIAIILRVEARQIAQVITTSPDNGSVNWSESFESATVLVPILVPLVVGLPAALVVCNKVQVSTLLTMSYLQIFYPVVIGTMTFRRTVDRLENLSPWTPGDANSQVVAQQLVFLAGCVCILLAVRAGQPKVPLSHR